MKPARASLFTALAAFVLLATAPAQAAGPGDPAGTRSYPDDPFAYDREHMAATQIGTARGQTRLSALGALVEGNNSAETYLGGQLAVEFMLHEFGGVRIAGFQDVVDVDGNGLAYKFSSIRVGPALHVQPYRRVDLGVYAEGGIVIVDFIDGKTSEKAPEATLGGFITIHIDSYLFIQMELERAWSNIEINNIYGNQDRSAAMLGLGLAF